MGPNHAVVTACSTGAHSIGDAARMIKDDDADIMLAGGAEATICPIGIAGFAQARALSTNFNDQPEKASRPYDKDRDGFVMGEGAGVVVLEEYEHAKKRGAKIYAEVVGYGLSGDAYHVTAPHPEGSGAYRSMQMAMKKSGLDLGDIDYINAHGTSTPLGDELELGAVRKLFGNHIATMSMSSTKSAIGHLLGGAGAVESIFCILAIRDQIVPPTLNLDNPSEGTAGVDLVPHVAKKREVKAVLNNSFGFGGTNASLVMKAV
jgi:3-oxoacyl-[acyl-carrier-protein] synthase II